MRLGRAGGSVGEPVGYCGEWRRCWNINGRVASTVWREGAAVWIEAQKGDRSLSLPCHTERAKFNSAFSVDECVTVIKIWQLCFLFMIKDVIRHSVKT